MRDRTRTWARYLRSEARWTKQSRATKSRGTKPDDPWLSLNRVMRSKMRDDEVRASLRGGHLTTKREEQPRGLLEKSGDYDRPRVVRRCCQQSPDDYDFAVNRACCARQRGAEDAEALFAEAAKLCARPYACAFNIAELAAARGDIQTALARAKEAVAHADADEIEDAREFLRSLLEAWRDSLDDANVIEDALAHGLEI